MVSLQLPRTRHCPAEKDPRLWSDQNCNGSRHEIESFCMALMYLEMTFYYRLFQHYCMYLFFPKKDSKWKFLSKYKLGECKHNEILWLCEKLTNLRFLCAAKSIKLLFFNYTIGVIQLIAQISLNLIKYK